MHTGIDIGCNATKAVTDKRRVTFPSAVGSPDRARFALNGGGDRAILLLLPSYVLIGEKALQHPFLNCKVSNSIRKFPLPPQTVTGSITASYRSTLCMKKYARKGREAHR